MCEMLRLFSKKFLWSRAEIESCPVRQSNKSRLGNGGHHPISLIIVDTGPKCDGGGVSVGGYPPYILAEHAQSWVDDKLYYLIDTDEIWHQKDYWLPNEPGWCHRPL